MDLSDAFVHNRTHVWVGCRIAYRQLCHALSNPLYEHIVKRLFDNRAGARRALLTAKSESRCDHALHGLIQIGVSGNND